MPVHAQPGVPVFRLQGGPGITNMEFPAASRFTDTHDVVLVGYRGVDGSSRLDCPEVSSSREHSRDLLGERSLRADASAYRSCADRLRGEGVDLAGYSIPERVDDLELARRAFGYHRIDLVSESAGTRTAMIYAWRYPKSIHRSVMIGVNPPGNFLWDAKTTGEQIRRYAAICAQDTSCRNRTPDLAASLHSSFAHVPDHWLFLPIKQGDARVAAFFGLINETSDGGGPIASPLTIDTPPLGRQGRRERRVVPVADGRARLPARAGLGRRGGDRPQRRDLCEALLRVGSKPWIADRLSRHRPDLGRRPPPRSLAGKPGRERVHPACRTRTWRRC